MPLSIVKKYSPTYQTRHIYSDNCFGQNKNYILATMFSLFTADPNYPLESIDNKFLEVGHTHMECDADHSRIEKKIQISKYTIQEIGYNS